MVEKLQASKIEKAGLFSFFERQKDDVEIKEMASLVVASGISLETELVQQGQAIDPKYYVGKGKAEEAKAAAALFELDLFVFNVDLSGTQMRNLEELIGVKIIDRTSLILDIFAKRAKSLAGKLQVKLAQLKYRLPRLIGYKDHLSRLGGGIGTRGPGEQQLETDRRHIVTEISRIEKKIKALAQRREMTRKKRSRSRLAQVAILGYTNAGKSSLLNNLLKLSATWHEGDNFGTQVLAKDMLFATLDPSMRRIKLASGQEIILADTVGFVSDLPADLITAFKSTLEEIKLADLILHVIDYSSQDQYLQIRSTMAILEELDCLEIPRINVFNKVDLVKEEFGLDLAGEENIFISAFNDADLKRLLDLVEENLKRNYQLALLKIPFEHYDIFSKLAETYQIEDLEHLSDGVTFRLKLSPIDYQRYQSFVQIL